MALKPLHDVTPVPRDLASLMPVSRQQALTPWPRSWPATKRTPLHLGLPCPDCSPPAPGPVQLASCQPSGLRSDGAASERRRQSPPTSSPGLLSSWHSLQYTMLVYLFVCLLIFCHSHPNASLERPRTVSCSRPHPSACLALRLRVAEQLARGHAAGEERG